jgi:hypothetical protein
LVATNLDLQLNRVCEASGCLGAVVVQLDLVVGCGTDLQRMQKQSVL